jgi:hypothetical protein
MGVPEWSTEFLLVVVQMVFIVCIIAPLVLICMHLDAITEEELFFQVAFPSVSLIFG